MRNLVQLILTKPAMLNHAKSDDEKLFAEKTMNRLIADEYGHIYYTADLIEKHSKDGFYDSLQSLYIEALGLFDKEARKFMWHNDTTPIK